MQIGDLQIGMILVNDGKSSIPLYSGETATGKPVLAVQPGHIIGQIVDFANGVGGTTVIFSDPSTEGALQVTTGPITDSGTLSEQAYSYSLSWLFDPVKVTATARFKDLQNNVSDLQIEEQAGAIEHHMAKGGTVMNSIKTAAHSAGEAGSAVLSGLGSGLWPWAMGAGAIYVALNWNKLKPK